MAKNKLYGSDVVVARVLQKVELAARRAVGVKYPGNIKVQSLMEEFANQLCKQVEEMYGQ